MPINFNGAGIGAVSYGSQGISEVYHGRDLVWQAISDVLVFPDGLTGLGARDFFRSELTARGLDYAKIVEVPFQMDTSNVTDMDYMFSGCRSLTSVPDLDTSNVTSMICMFENCWSLTSVPDLDASKVTDTSYMLFFCSSLTDGNVRLIRASGTLPSRRSNMIMESGLTREPFFDANGNPIP